MNPLRPSRFDELGLRLALANSWLLAPAIKLAEEGFVVDEAYLSELEAGRKRVAKPVPKAAARRGAKRKTARKIRAKRVNKAGRRG